MARLSYQYIEAEWSRWPKKATRKIGKIEYIVEVNSVIDQNTYVYIFMIARIHIETTAIETTALLTISVVFLFTVCD